MQRIKEKITCAWIVSSYNRRQLNGQNENGNISIQMKSKLQGFQWKLKKATSPFSNYTT